MNILLLEDEPPAAEKLAAFVHQYNPAAAVVAVLAHVQEARAWLGTHPQPDLVLSDIELRGGNVFPLYEERLITCPIIFTTAYDAFFVQAFEQNGIAYLLKPFQYPQFCAAMQKYEHLRHTFQHALLTHLSASLQAPRKTYKQRFVIKAKGGIVLLETKDIAYVQLRNGLAHAHDWQGRSHLLAESLSQLEELLDPGQFFRLNRSDLVHLSAIDRLEPHFNDGLAVKLKLPGVTLIASAPRTPELRKWLNG